MTFGPLPSLGSVLGALLAVDEGRPVDFAAVRAALAAEREQWAALAREADGAGLCAGSEAAEHLAAVIEGLAAVVDRLEEGDPVGARAEFRRALRPDR